MAATGMRKRVKKSEKTVKKPIKKTVKKAEKKNAGLKKELIRGGKKLKAKVQTVGAKAEKKLVQAKEALIVKLKEELAEKKKIIRASEETLKEAAEKAGLEVADLKHKTRQGLQEMQSWAEAEAKRWQEELDAKSQALLGKALELDEYRKTAEGKISELQAKVREVAGRLLPAEKERTGLVMFKGASLTLLGSELKIGDKAPDFQVIDNAMQPATLRSFQGKLKIISAVPSLDTPVCSTETHRFNEEAGKLPDRVSVLTLSMDLPFAQARWCAAAGVDKVKTFSDYQDRSFGLAWGILLKEMKLLARAVFIVDEQDFIRYIELVPEISREPDYDRILGVVRALLA